MANGYRPVVLCANGTMVDDSDDPAHEPTPVPMQEQESTPAPQPSPYEQRQDARLDLAQSMWTKTSEPGFHYRDLDTLMEYEYLC